MTWRPYRAAATQKAFSLLSALIRRPEITLVNTSLADQFREATDGDAQPLGKSHAGEALTEAELNGLLLRLCREPAHGLGWVGHRPTA